MITSVKNFAPDADIISVKTSEGDTILIERDEFMNVHVIIQDSRDPKNTKDLILGEEEE